jgi:hypothetical protein
MLKKSILSKFHQSKVYLYLTARQLTRFYAVSFARPEVPVIPASSLRHVNSLLTYMWDIREEIDMMNIIQENTEDLQALYDRLQGLCDYAY